MEVRFVWGQTELSVLPHFIIPRWMGTQTFISFKRFPLKRGKGYHILAFNQNYIVLKAFLFQLYIFAICSSIIMCYPACEGNVTSSYTSYNNLLHIFPSHLLYQGNVRFIQILLLFLQYLECSQWNTSFPFACKHKKKSFTFVLDIKVWSFLQRHKKENCIQFQNWIHFLINIWLIYSLAHKL